MGISKDKQHTSIYIDPEAGKALVYTDDISVIQEIDKMAVESGDVEILDEMHDETGVIARRYRIPENFINIGK